jgi:hypothetical protein
MMNRKFITFVVVSALSAMAAPASADPCGAILCLSTNKTAPHQCKEHVDEYFSIRVYHTVHKKKVFDPGATAGKRYKESMDKCDGAEQKDKDYVNGLYGTLERSPWDYVDVEESTGESTGYSDDSLTKTVESRYVTCDQAANNPAYSGMVGSPTSAARQIPNGSVLVDEGGAPVQIMGGWTNHVLGYDQSQGGGLWGQGTPIYGFAVETRTVTTTSGQGKWVSETNWTASKTSNCVMNNPMTYWQQIQNANSSGG